jgi:hypothetical protein
VELVGPTLGPDVSAAVVVGAATVGESVVDDEESSPPHAATSALDTARPVITASQTPVRRMGAHYEDSWRAGWRRFPCGSRRVYGAHVPLRSAGWHRKYKKCKVISQIQFFGSLADSR